jgi:NhaP-type Na+/H+ or K+/H+ antiporter
MSETVHYGLLLAVSAAVALAAVLSNRLTERIRIPVPLLMLAGSAVAVAVVGPLHLPGEQTVERVVTAALVLILFDGGMHIGWTRFRAAAGPIGIVGVAGTFLTAAAGALLLHAVFGSAGTSRSWSRPRWPRPTPRSCSPSSADRRSPGAAGPSSRASRARTIPSASR